jgi:hypothetical protein
VVWILGAVVGGYLLLTLAIEAYVAIVQPRVGGPEAVLRTFDGDGTPHDKRLALIEDGETLWVQSGHHFRGWYHRLRRNPEVELIRDGVATPYRAVALDTQEARDHVVALLRKRGSAGRFYTIRALLLFAPIKPVRLDPR